MRIFVAGASGAIGRPLIVQLVSQGHQVTGMTRSESAARELAQLGAGAALVSAFDSQAVERALRESEAEVVIDQLTSLPKDPAQLAEALPGDRKLRIEGGGNLYRAAEVNGVRRYLQQSSGFFLMPGDGLADESESLAVDASPGVAWSARTYAELETRALSSHRMEGVILRYGFFYGPGTWYHAKGAVAHQVRQRQFLIVGKGHGVWSFVHVEDAAAATVAALGAEPGVYNIVDSDPSPVSDWLPKFAKWVGGPPPPLISEQEALAVAGEDAVYYGTRLRGASNQKALKMLGFKPRRLEWLKD